MNKRNANNSSNAAKAEPVLPKLKALTLREYTHVCGGTEKVLVAAQYTLKLREDIRCVQVQKKGFPDTALVPVESIQVMTLEGLNE